MAIISAAICDKQGKILVARQFEKLTKHNLEENLHSFPKMIANNQQHTFVENDKVRYVYMPIDNLYLVLITSKNSNIIEHQETIRLIYKSILEICPQGINDETVSTFAFDIALALDDIISFGYRESISLQQVLNAQEMESSEEKLHQMLMQARINEAQENAQKHIKEQERKHKGGKGELPQLGIQDTSQFTSIQDVLEDQQPIVQSQPPGKPTNVAPKKGMQLGKKKTTKQVQKELKQKAQEKKTKSTNELEEEISKEEGGNKPQKFDPLKEPIEIDLVEKFSVKMARDGSFQGNLEVVGELYLNVLDPSKSKTQIALECVPNDRLKSVKFMVNPNLNKQLWNKNKVISLKKPEEDSFPVQQKVQTVKYKYTTSDHEEIPFTFTFWFDKTLTLEIEFNAEQSHFEQLENFAVRIPYSDSASNIEVKNVDNGDFNIESGTGVTWNIAKLDGNDNTSASIEIDFGDNIEEDDLLPINFYFEYPKTFIELNVRGVRELENSENLKFKFNREIQADKLFIE